MLEKLKDSLTDKLTSSKRYVTSLGSREQFKEIYLDKLVNSAELKDYFFDGNQRKKDSQQELYFDELVSMVDKAYDQYGINNFEQKGLLTRFVAKPLRLLSSAGAVFGHYMMNVYLQPEAYRFAVMHALAGMAIADTIEGLEHLYRNHEKCDLAQVPKLVAEGVVEKALTILPVYATPVMEATLGNTKFDRAVANKILYHVKDAFVEKFGEQEISKEV